VIALLNKNRFLQWLPTLKLGGARKGWYMGWHWEYLGITEEPYPFINGSVWYSYNYRFMKEGTLIRDSFMSHIDYNTDFKWMAEHQLDYQIRHNFFQ